MVTGPISKKPDNFFDIGKMLLSTAIIRNCAAIKCFFK